MTTEQFLILERAYSNMLFAVMDFDGNLGQDELDLKKKEILEKEFEKSNIHISFS